MHLPIFSRFKKNIPKSFLQSSYFSSINLSKHMSSKISYLRRIVLFEHVVIIFSDCKMLTISSPISSFLTPGKNFSALLNTIFSIASLTAECVIPCGNVFPLIHIISFQIKFLKPSISLIFLKSFISFTSKLR